MSKRNRREHGRILSVETMQRGSALDVDAAAGATSITVVDGGDFDEDGGWLYIGAQVVEFTACDDDTGIITFKTGTTLTAAAEQGDPVAVYDPLYGEVVDYQVALVQLDGEYDNPDVVVAEVAEGVEDLPEGDRGKAGESCTLHRVADDEWEVVGVGGRSRKSRGLRAEADDFYVLTSDDIAAGSATIPLAHRPADEWLILWWRTVAQEPTEYTINYDAQTITYPLGGFEAAGDRLWVHYAHRKGVNTPAAVENYVTVARDAGATAMWRLGEASASSPMTDSSGNHRDGSYSTSPNLTLGVSGLLANDPDTAADSALSGIGSIDHASWMDTAQLGLEAIVRPDSLAGGPYTIIGRDQYATSQRVFQFRIYAGKLELVFWTETGGPFVVTGATTLTAGVKRHVAASFDGTTARVLLEGNVDGAADVSGSLALRSNGLTIGYDLSAGGIGTADMFDGPIDEVYMYPTAPTPAWFAAHAAQAF